jgi:hypothetical protein
MRRESREFKKYIASLAPKGYCTVYDLARALKVSDETVYGWVYSNKTPYWKLCGMYFVPIGFAVIKPNPREFYSQYFKTNWKRKKIRQPGKRPVYKWVESTKHSNGDRTTNV